MTFTKNRKALIAAVSAGAIVLAGSGVMLGRTLLAPLPPQTAVSDQGAPVDPAEHSPEGFVAVDTARAQAAGIVTETVRTGGLGSEILAQGVVAPTPDGEAVLTARADGAIVRINRRLGDFVRAGEAVAIMESREAAAISAQRGTAEAKLALARSAYTREQRLFDARVTARQDLEAARAALAEAAAEARLADGAAAAANVSGDGRQLAVVSLIAGRVTRTDAKLGAYALAGTELFRVSAPDRIQINASAAAAEARRIRPGDTAVIELPGGGTMGAVVRSTTPSLDPESKSATIVLQPEGLGGLTQGQGLRVRIKPRGAPAGAAIALPEEAVQSIEGRDVVFVRTATGFRATKVMTGQRGGGRIEVLEGLKSGTIVATRGAFVLKAELGKSEAEH